MGREFSTPPSPTPSGPFLCLSFLPSAFCFCVFSANLPLCFQSLPRCSSCNPFLFKLLHCCRRWVYPPAAKTLHNHKKNEGIMTTTDTLNPEAPRISIATEVAEPAETSPS